jgi:hypothetical protein
VTQQELTTHLDLGLLIDAEHQGGFGRVQVEPDDVANLLDELGSLESLKFSTR